MAITRELLIKVHDLLYPWPKSSQIDWATVPNISWEPPNDNTPQVLFKLLRPVWRELSEKPLTVVLPSSSSHTFLEECCGLFHILDQTRSYFQGIDQRYTNGFFDSHMEKLAKELFYLENTPLRKDIWIDRGWSFEHYILRIMGLWAPLVHSEEIMTKYWNDINRSMIVYLRNETQQYTGKKDPGAATEDEDEKDLQLFAKIIRTPGGPAKDVAEIVFPLLRIITAHLPITNEFGRYPYRNDVLGRDFNPGEEEWIEKNPPFKRLDSKIRDAIRKDVDAGVWSPLKLDYELPVDD